MLMFTGLVEETGTIADVCTDGNGLTVSVFAKTVLEDMNEGDSIAVNGTCLTVTGHTDALFTAGIAPETRKCTTLGSLVRGECVNLERAMLPTTRIGGHFVQGHVDGTGIIKSVLPEKNSLRFSIGIDPVLLPCIVKKGYIAVDGVSLTVTDTEKDRFHVMLVEYTQGKITLPHKDPGDLVNIEVDILAKYIARLCHRDTGSLFLPETEKISMKETVS